MAKTCERCGAIIADDSVFCTVCGARQNVPAAPRAAQPTTAVMPVYSTADQPAAVATPAYNYAEQPISTEAVTQTAPTTATYIGWLLLALVPVVGSVFMIVWAFMASRLQRMFFARGMIVTKIILLLLWLVAFLVYSLAL